MGVIRKFPLTGACIVMLMCALASAVGVRDSAAGNKNADSKKSAAPEHPKASSGAESVKKPSSKTSSGKHSSRKKKKSSRVRGQQKIDSERAEAIQEALIREHYLNGTPTGVWNQASEEAMRRYQADNGWQSKTVPDSRALIKLGLGPSKDHLLNPESAMTTGPDSPKAEPVAPTSHSAPTVANPTPATSQPSPTPASDSSNPQ